MFSQRLNPAQLGVRVFAVVLGPFLFVQNSADNAKMQSLVARLDAGSQAIQDMNKLYIALEKNLNVASFFFNSQVLSVVCMLDVKLPQITFEFFRLFSSLNFQKALSWQEVQLLAQNQNLTSENYTLPYVFLRNRIPEEFIPDQRPAQRLRFFGMSSNFLANAGFSLVMIALAWAFFAFAHGKYSDVLSQSYFYVANTSYKRDLYNFAFTALLKVHDIALLNVQMSLNLQLRHLNNRSVLNVISAVLGGLMLLEFLAVYAYAFRKLNFRNISEEDVKLQVDFLGALVDNIQYNRRYQESDEDSAASEYLNTTRRRLVANYRFLTLAKKVIFGLILVNMLENVRAQLACLVVLHLLMFVVTAALRPFILSVHNALKIIGDFALLALFSFCLQVVRQYEELTHQKSLRQDLIVRYFQSGQVLQIVCYVYCAAHVGIFVIGLLAFAFYTQKNLRRAPVIEKPVTELGVISIPTNTVLELTRPQNFALGLARRFNRATFMQLQNEQSASRQTQRQRRFLSEIAASLSR